MTESELTQSIQPPKTVEALLNRTKTMSGLTVQQLSDQLDVSVPDDLKKEKGWVGQLIETYLGADAGSRPIPDFTLLDIELKTIPITTQGKPFYHHGIYTGRKQN